MWNSQAACMEHTLITHWWVKKSLWHACDSPSSPIRTLTCLTYKNPWWRQCNRKTSELCCGVHLLCCIFYSILFLGSGLLWVKCSLWLQHVQRKKKTCLCQAWLSSFAVFYFVTKDVPLDESAADLSVVHGEFPVRQQRVWCECTCEVRALQK